MNPAAPPTQATAPPAPARGRPENLALVFQEMLTAVVRLRSNRQPVTDAEVFRNQMRQAIRVADQDARRLGYIEEDIRLGIFAVVAFLDESVLNLNNPVFYDWVRKPMQEELFGRHTAGEIFFDQLQQLLGRRETPELADLLEVFQLCLLLGFVGRYSISGRGELKVVTDALADKIRRVRQERTGISSLWQLPEQRRMIVAGDAWIKRLAWVAGSAGVLAIGLWVLYYALLRSGLSELKSLVPGLGR
jgi:type VI secretion system protein ImpK